jgi:hypothetical protein
VRTPGALLLHPLALGALFVLLLNDQVLKRVSPGALSGKLSDAAGMVLFPLVLHAIVELGAAKIGRALSERRSFRALLALVGATWVGFTLVEMTAFGDVLYRVGLGALQWPFRALLKLASGAGVPSLRPVAATPDPTDLLTLPFGLLALAIARRGSAVAVAAGVVLVIGTLSPRSAHAAPPTSMPKDPGTERRHDGMYLDLDVGAGGFFTSSSSSISNGFRQPIPSSTQGTAFPSVSLGFGGTLPRTSIVLGGRLARVETSEPAIDSLDQRFRLPQFRLAATDLSVFCRYYPNPYGGFHVGGGLGVLWLAAQENVDPLADENLPEGKTQVGVSFSPEVGQSFWLRNEISMGVATRLLVARAWGGEGGTTLFAPVLLASLSWN